MLNEGEYYLQLCAAHARWFPQERVKRVPEPVDFPCAAGLCNNRFECLVSIYLDAEGGNYVPRSGDTHKSEQ